MYYPYFRGKQFDLLALKTLLQTDKLSQKIIPIIEPVKDSKTLMQTVTLFKSKQHPFYLLDNPEKGDFLTPTAQLKLAELAENHQAHRLTPTSLTNELLAKENLLWWGNSAATLKEIELTKVAGKFIVPNEMRILRQFSPQQSLILLEDHFTRLPRNRYYREFSDEIFTRQHLTYQKRGFVGFGDFSLDSRIYYEQGYPDQDLCLHLVYQQEDSLRVHHFVSSENLAEKSQLEKFLSVMENVAQWQQNNKITQTSGLEILQKAFLERRFPGMGVLRKAMIMHHLETMGELLKDSI